MVGVPVVHVLVRCGLVRRVGWVTCAGRLRWGVVVMELVGVAVVLGHRGVGVGGGRGLVMVLVVPCLYGVDVCGQWSLTGLWWALVRVMLLVCPGGRGVRWCGVAGPGSRPGCRALMAGAIADPLTCLGLRGLVGVGDGWSAVSPRG